MPGEDPSGLGMYGEEPSNPQDLAWLEICRAIRALVQGVVDAENPPRSIP